MSSVQTIVNSAVATAVDRTFRHFGTQTTTSSGKKGIDAGGTSFQRDSKLIYKRKPQPKKKRRRWRKFVKKVQAATQKEKGLRTVTVCGKQTVSVPAATQKPYYVHLYGYTGLDSSEELGAGDIKYVISNDFDTKTTDESAIGSVFKDVNKNVSKIKFTSAKLQLDILNTSTSGVILDMYFLEYNRKSVDTNLGTSYVNAQAATEEIQEPIAPFNDQPKIEITKYGVTPFELGNFISRGGYTIQKVVTKQIPAGDLVTEQIRDARNYIMHIPTVLADNGVLAHPKYTETILFLIRNPKASGEAATVSFNVTRTYKYQIDGVNETANRYFG